MPGLLPLAFKADYLSEYTHCKDCQRKHGKLTRPGIVGQRQPKGIIRKITFWMETPFYEGITGYINGFALPLTMTDPVFKGAFVWLMESRHVQKVKQSLCEYYCLKHTVITGTQRLDHYKHDSRLGNPLHYNERLGKDCHVAWVHPYVLATYLELLNMCAPDVTDAQLLRAYLPARMLSEQKHFLLEMGFPAFDPMLWSEFASFFPRQSPTPPPPDFVYLIQKERKRIYKIGFSKDPERRLGNLMTSTPDPLHLLYFWETPDARKIERNLHEKFAAAKIQGEWFALSHDQEAELIVYMAQFTKRNGFTSK